MINYFFPQTLIPKPEGVHSTVLRVVVAVKEVEVEVRVVVFQ